ncbi:MAG TPA: hypothetical protein VIE69_01460 [Methylophilaceae bacterium]|jgi:hypothetical protein
MPSLLAAIIALFSPENILDRLPFMWKITLWVSSIIPSMKEHMELSHFPQVTIATFTIAWFCFPFQLIYLTFIIWQKADLEKLHSIMPDLKTRLKYTVNGVVICAVWVWALCFLAEDPTWVGRYGVANSRLGLAFYGVGAIWLFPLIFGFTLVLLFKQKWRDRVL